MGTIHFFAPDTDAFVASVTRHIPEFEAQSGERVKLTIIPSDEYFSNQIHRYLDGENMADVYMSGPVLLWEHIRGGYVEPLDRYTSGTSAAYGFSDFLPSLLKANRWTGRFGDPLGEGPLLAIPVNCESYNLAYVPSLLEKAGVGVPQTWEEYFSTAQMIADRCGPGVRGFGQRGIHVWHTMYTGFATQFWSHGAKDFDANKRCAIASHEGIKATESFVAALRVAGPRDWPNQRWYELALDFANGHYGMLVDSDHYVAFFEDPKLSSLVGKIAYAPPPAGPSGLRKPNLWTWSMVMNGRSRNKDSAWRFMEWATGRDFLLRSAFEGNMNPTRTSVWNHDTFVEHTASWGNFYKTSRDLVTKTGQVLVTPATNYRELAARWSAALLDCYRGQDSVANILRKAATEIDALVQVDSAGLKTHLGP